MNKIILILIGIVLISSIGVNAFGVANADLKVKVKMKYSDLVKDQGTGKAYFRFYDESQDFIGEKTFPKNKFPKSVTLTFPNGAVDVYEGFKVCLNSYKYDSGDCKEGINSPKKSPEKISMRFPT